MIGPDSRPFGKALGWVATGVIALGALPAPLTAGPLVRPLYASGAPTLGWDARAANPALLVVLATYGAVFIAILALIAYGVRRASYAGGRREWETLRALGQDRQSFIHGQARRGAVMGLRAAGAAVALAAFVVEALSLSHSEGSRIGVALNAWALADYAASIAIATAAAAAVFALVALHLTAEHTPRKRAIPTTTVVEEHRWDANRRRLRSGAVGFVGAVVLASIVYQAWLWFHPERFAPSADSVSPVTGSRWGETPTRMLVLLCLVLALLAAATRVSLTITTLLGRRWSRSKHTLFAVAGDGLARRAVERTFAAATMAVVLGIAAYAAAGASITNAKTSAASDLDADYTITIATTVADNQLPNHFPAGYSRDVLPAALVDALQSDPRLIVVPVGIFYTDPVYVTQAWGAVEDNDGVHELHWYQDSYAVFDPSLSGSRRHDEWLALGLGGANVLHNGHFFLSRERGEPGAAVLTAGGQRYDTFRVDGPRDVTAIDAAWATPRFGAPPANALMIYLADPAGLGAGDRGAMISQIVADVAPAGLHYASTQGPSDGGARGWSSVGIPAGGTVAVLLGIVFGVALTVVLAAASARSRRGDLATLAALGARPWTLRASPGVEAGATALVASAVGTAVGAGVAILRAHPTLFHAGGNFDPGTISQILWWNTSHVFWVYPLVMIATATVATTMVGLLYGFEAQRHTPVEELREAVKEGSL